MANRVVLRKAPRNARSAYRVGYATRVVSRCVYTGWPPSGVDLLRNLSGSNLEAPHDLESGLIPALAPRSSTLRSCKDESESSGSTSARHATRSSFRRGLIIGIQNSNRSDPNSKSFARIPARGLHTCAQRHTHRREETSSPPRRLHAGKVRNIATQVESQTVSGPPAIPPGGLKRTKTKEELQRWQEEYDLEQAGLLEASFYRPENGSDFIREQRNQLLMPPRYVQGGDLPANFLREEKDGLSTRPRARQVGDVMVYLEDGIPQCAVLVRRWEESRDFYYDVDGNTMDTKQDSTNAIIFPGYIDPKEILPILPHLPPAPEELRSANVEVPRVPGSAGISLRRHLAKIRDEIQDTLNTHFEQFGSLWDRFAYEDKLRIMSLEDMAAAVFNTSRNELTMAQNGALFCCLFQSSSPFIRERADMTQLTDTSFDIAIVVLSRKDKALIQQVVEWYQEYRNAKTQQEMDSSTFGQFLQYARALIKDSRAQRYPVLSGFLGAYGKSPVEDARLDMLTSNSEQPTSTARSTDLWPTGTCEATMLQYLRRANKLRFKAWPSFFDSEQNVIPAILRATGMYGHLNFTAQLFRLFLRELGLLVPWQDPEDTAGPLWEDVYHDHKLNALVDNAAETFENQADSLQHMRHDWGNMEVFCIDASTTEVIDDGFSLEPVAGEPESFWIHVHIANPTAFMDSNDRIATAASRRVTSLYSIGNHRAMLPDAISHRCSLGADRPTLTFSAKIHQNGEILEQKIAPGYIHNVIRITPSVFDRLLGSSALIEQSTRTFIVGDRDIAESFTENELQAGDKIDQSQTASLLQLHKLAKAIKARWDQTDFDTYRPRYSASSLHVSGMDALRLTEDRPYRPSADPTIVLSSTVALFKHGSEYVRVDEGSLTIEIIMQLASRIAAEYCSERNIPVMFSNLFHDSALPDPSRYHEEFFRRIPMDRPLVRDLAIRSVIKRRGPIGLSPSPQSDPHIASRASSTSPLRRFPDLFTHFQIQRSLQLEADGSGSKAQFEHNDPRLPYSYDQLTALLPHVERNRRFWTRRNALTTRIWFHQLVNRALRFGEDPSFPRYIEVMVHNQALTNVIVFSPLLGRVFPMATDAHNTPLEGYVVGEWWLAEFKMKPDDAAEHLLPIARLGREYPDGYKNMDDPTNI